MVYNQQTVQRFRGVAFLGNYLPRICGIATFTHDLGAAMTSLCGEDQSVIFTAMNDLPEGYAYPDQVKFELRQDHLPDYSRAADFLNFSHIDIVSLQHEYGIFGGEYGANVITFLKDLNRPIVVTCHTVLENPIPAQKDMMREIASHAEKLIVMSQRAVGFLENSYGIAANKVVYIPHGIHDAPFIDPNYYKDKYGVEGRRVLLTFGLLRREKGIEYMIEALPQIVQRHPKTTYVILGATHPAVIRDEGESYRLSLQRRVQELGLEEHVLFYPMFVELDELLEYLGAADILVTPYLYLEQITSGVLSYAMGTGKAVVSTPYWHAEELLADGRGCLVPFRDPSTLAQTINELLDDDTKLNAIRKRAYTHCRPMVWSEVAHNYLRLFDEVRHRVPKQFPMASAVRSPIATANLPLPKIDHLLRLSDDTGPSRFARYTVPDRNTGYGLEDAAMTLVACAKFNDIYKSDKAEKLMERCLTLLHTLIGFHDHTGIAAGLDYTRRKEGIASEDAVGKAIWALGYMVWRAPKYLSATANDLFHQILVPRAMTSPRAASYAVLGACNYLQLFPGASAVKRFLSEQIKTLERYMAKPCWWEKWSSADWPVLSQAIAMAARFLDDDRLRKEGQTLVSQLCETTASGTLFLKQGHNSDGEELPVTCATFIEALGASFFDSRDRDLLVPIRSALDWFLGVNRLNAPIYNFFTGGCHDAMTFTGVNGNQGTESTAYCLLAFLSLNRIVGLPDPAN